jgi:DNA-binding NarL/FixJ family response regulator
MIVMERVPVLVHARDPISQAGIATQLRMRPEIRIVDDPQEEPADVAVLVGDEVDEDTIRVIKAVQRNGVKGVVLIVTRVDDNGLLAAAEGGVSALVRRADATTETLVTAVKRVIVGEGSVPPDLLGRLLAQVGRLQRHVLAPRGLSFTGLSQREVEVLKLVAEGCGTGEIAKRLAYSERTIKNVIHDVTTRLNLRNRSHAVAYAMREGLI